MWLQYHLYDGIRMLYVYKKTVLAFELDLIVVCSSKISLNLCLYILHLASFLTVENLKGQSQLLKGRPIYSNDCGKYSLCQLDHAQ